MKKTMRRVKRMLGVLAVLGALCLAAGVSTEALAATVKDSASDDTVAGANAMRLGDTASGNITEDDDLDYYKFQAVSAGCVTLDMTSYMRYYCIRLYDSEGDEIWYTDENEYTESVGYRRDTYRLYLEQGTYYMQINGYNRSTILKYTGRYVCKASFVSSGTNNVEKDDSFSSANPVVFGRTMVGQISMNDDYDMYRFTLSKIGCVTLDMTSYMPYYCIRISDANGKEIWYVDRNKWNGDVGYRRDTYNLYLEKGTYYMQVNAYIYATVSGYTGRYVLNAKYTPSKVSFEGDDDSFATAKSISSDVKYTGQMSLGEDWDTYKFVMLSGKEVEVNMASYMRYYCIRIFDSNGKEVWYTDKNEWNSDVGYRKDIHKIKLSTGTYYMQVNGYSSYGVTPYRDQATGKYVFSVNGICNHKYKSTTTKAGVSTNGSITKTCSKCGKKTKTVIYAAKYIKLSKALFTYDGKTHKPTVTLVDSKGKKLKSGTDYTLKYSGDCKNVGKYKVTAVFKGNYKGTHSSTITIRPKGLGISKLIPASRDFRVNWKKQTVQTKGYELQYSTTSKFSKKDTKSVMLKNTTTSKKVTGVQPNKKYYVRIRSYKEVTVNGKKEKIYSAWSGTKWVQTKP